MVEEPTPTAEDLFARWIEAGHDASAHAVDALCAEHPEHADALRRVAAGWRLMQRGLEDDAAADGTVAVGPREGGGSGAWDALIAQLRERGPSHTRYVFEGELARGGMGAIHQVFDRDIRRRLALKVLLEHQAAPTDDISLGRFLEEAQVTGQLDHPGIVPVHEVGVDDDGRVYFTMKLVKGDELRSVFDRVADPSDEEWTTPRALNVMLRVCEAMAYAHAKGVVHRDLKPGNVMVGKFGEAYVMDWGLAKVLGQEGAHDVRLRPDVTATLKTERAEAAAATPDSPVLTMDGAVVGTPAYMPPEQARGGAEDVGPPADVYAIGAMLYHLLAGHAPYLRPGDRLSSWTIVAMVENGPPGPLSAEAPDAPAELVAIVERAMAREVRDRYPDMAALAADLRAHLEQRVVRAHAVGPLAELQKWIARNRAVAATAVAALGVVVVLTLVFVGRLRAERNVAAARADDVLRLSDKRRLEELVVELDDLWPAHPDLEDRMRDWRGRAADLLKRLPIHRDTLAALEDGDVEVETRWWRAALSDLVTGLDALAAADETGMTLAALDSRLVMSSTLRARSVDEPAAAWRDAVESIADRTECPAYDGLEVTPQLGLVPLGRDATSGMWEFWHVASGERSRRDEHGRVVLDDGDGLVLVLVPGADWLLGTQKSDPQRPRHDPGTIPKEAGPFPVRLDPFFVSKYETTQAQWERWTGRNPSVFTPGGEVAGTLVTGLHPVVNLAWTEAVRQAFRLGLELPTEAQWEYACLAGADLVWHTGNVAESLAGSANYADEASARHYQPGWPFTPGTEDGFAISAPVGRFRANAFGLYDMHGNATEWCRDEAVDYRHAPAEAFEDGTGLLRAKGSTMRSGRGGGFGDIPVNLRAASRYFQTFNDAHTDIGARFVRRVEP